MVIGSDQWLLNPRGWWSTRWDLSIAFLLLITMITMPLTMAFKVIPSFHSKIFPEFRDNCTFVDRSSTAIEIEF